MRAITIIAIVVLTVATSASALEWRACYRELDELNKKNPSNSVRLMTYEAQKLNDMYDAITTQRLNYRRCNHTEMYTQPADNSFYCINALRMLNKLTDDYQKERESFSRKMSSVGTFSPDEDQPCGFVVK